MSFYTGNIANLAGYPPLTKNIFLWNTSLTQPIYWVYIYFEPIEENISLGSIKEFAEEKSEEVEAYRQLAGRPNTPGQLACPFSSSVGFNLSRGDAPLKSQVKSRELIKVLCTHSIKLSSLHCLRTSKRSSMGVGGVSALCCQRFWGAKKKERKNKK